MKISYIIRGNLGYIGIMWDIGKRLRERREKAGLTQGQLEEYGVIKKSYLSNFETGTNQPKVWPLLAKLAERYKTSTDYILGLTDDPSPNPKRDLCDDSQSVIECMDEMTPRARAELLTICKSLLEVDRGWQELELMSSIAASLAGEDRIKVFQAELSLLTAQLGSRTAALRVLHDRYALASLSSDEG